MELKRRYPDGEVHIDEKALYKLQAELLAERCAMLREAMAWAVDKLRKLESELALTRRRLEYHEATAREVREAIGDGNPRLSPEPGRE